MSVSRPEKPKNTQSRSRHTPSQTQPKPAAANQPAAPNPTPPSPSAPPPPVPSTTGAKSSQTPAERQPSADSSPRFLAPTPQQNPRSALRSLASQPSDSAPRFTTNPKPTPSTRSPVDTAKQAVSKVMSSKYGKYLWRGKIMPAFWTVASILSLIINIILISTLLSIGRSTYMLKSPLEEQLLGGLYQNFALMDQAHIRAQIPVNDKVQAKFNLPLKQETTVKLTKNTTIRGATLNYLQTGGLTIVNAVADITLPAGSDLPVILDMTIPVDTTIPVSLMVNVDIPLNKTELHAPFVGLQKVVVPYYRLVSEMPTTIGDAICGPNPSWACKLLFK